MKTPNGFVRQHVDVYATPDGRFVIVGTPLDSEDEERGHNCDAMGCGQEHVLHRGRCDELRKKDGAK